jgi:hypothetical protein
LTIELGWTRYAVGAQRSFLAAYEEALPERTALSPLGGVFTVEVGPLNSAVDLFWYPDRATRDAVAVTVEALVGWPVEHPNIVERTGVKIYEDAPYNPPFDPGTYGSVYELRRYEFEPGTIDLAFAAWAPRLDARRALSPFLGAWWAEEGGVDAYLHLWAYRDAAERHRVRAEAASSGIWPPASTTILRQESTLLTPAPFSPIQ